MSEFWWLLWWMIWIFEFLQNARTLNKFFGYKNCKISEEKSCDFIFFLQFPKVFELNEAFFFIIRACRGGSCFSRVAGGFSKNFKNFVDTLFYIEQIDFLSSPKSISRPNFDQIFCAAGKFLKKQAKIRVLRRLFLENLTETPRFFWPALSPQS